MSTLFKRSDFNRLVELSGQYNSYTWAVEDSAEKQKVEANNEVVEKEFNEIVRKYIADYNNGVCWVKVCADSANGGSVETVLGRWISRQDFELESLIPKPKRIWTEQEIRELVQVNDTVLYNALKKLYARQTELERRNGETTERNGVGFNGFDADFLTNVTQFLERTGYLTDKQKAVARKKLVKYTKQLTVIANE